MCSQPSHVRGVTGVAGVYFLGLPWLYTWGSGRFSGIARDALYMAEQIEARRAQADHVQTSAVEDLLLS